MAEYLEAKHVLAVASGTAAMHLALVALGIEAGDEVITTPITWPATANVIVHTGATPVFVDVREGDLNIDPALIGAAVTERTKAIMPVHLAGQPARHGSDLGARDPRDRGRRPRGRERLPRPQARRALRGDVLQPLRDEEHRRRRGRARLDELGRGRRRDPQPPPDAPRRRLALRHHGARLQGQPLRRARGDRARPARQAAGAHRRAASASSRSTTRGSPAWTGSSRSSATPATRTHSTSTSSASTPIASG